MLSSMREAVASDTWCGFSSFGRWAIRRSAGAEATSKSMGASNRHRASQVSLARLSAACEHLASCVSAFCCLTVSCCERLPDGFSFCVCIFGQCCCLRWQLIVRQTTRPLLRAHRRLLVARIVWMLLLLSLLQRVGTGSRQAGTHRERSREGGKCDSLTRRWKAAASKGTRIRVSTAQWGQAAQRRRSNSAA